MVIKENVDAVKYYNLIYRAEFELTEEEKQKFRSSSPTTE